MDFPVIKEKQIVGAGLRNAGCHVCGSTDRERLIYLYLKHMTSLFDSKNTKILHIAPEQQLSRKQLDFGFTNYVCGDLYAQGYSYPDHVKNMNVLDLPFGDDYFDVILCKHVLEHVIDDTAAMKELLRVLRPGGFAVLQVLLSLNSPDTFEDFSITDPKQRELVFGQSDHVRVYGQDYIDRLSSAGFCVDVFRPPTQFQRHGINEKETVFVAKKASRLKPSRNRAPICVVTTKLECRLIAIRFYKLKYN